MNARSISLAATLLAVANVGVSDRLALRENIFLKENCGPGRKPSYKSLGGRSVRVNEYPWNVLIRISNSRGNATCSGSLISSRHILTAAHCMAVPYDKKQCQLPRKKRKISTILKAENFKIYVGTKCPFQEGCVPASQIRKAWLHERWVRCGLKKNDIAIIELDRDISPRQAVPICMPESDTPLARRLQSSGVGRDTAGETTRHLTVVTFDTYEEYPELNKIITYTRTTRASCPGDSGAGMFQMNQKRRYTLVGVHNSGSDCSTSSLAKYEKGLLFNHFADVRRAVEWVCARSGVCPLDKGRGYGDRSNKATAGSH
ncbi:hypothetical protein Q1695_007569 [Nippostrongylus brasiliensis]|nr:hypothetical protein Q1695_007569 [Nippostrongylus brasiliensis]